MGHLGTMTTQELQKTIKSILKKMAWSQERLAREFYCDQNEDDFDQVGEDKYVESFKKSLQRPTTSPEKLTRCLKFLQEDRSFKKIDMVRNQTPDNKDLSPTLSKALKEISHDISMDLNDKTLF